MGFLILGSIGEFCHLWKKRNMIQEALDYVDYRVTVYVGTGGTVLRNVELSRFALDRGADGVMVISPYYFNLPDSSILNFYDTLAGQLDGPVLLYNFPARTGYDLGNRRWCLNWPAAGRILWG
ncbi:MAG: dihydrodipicolinate synthase family protein [Enterocloster sp.]